MLFWIFPVTRLLGLMVSIIYFSKKSGPSLGVSFASYASISIIIRWTSLASTIPTSLLSPKTIVQKLFMILGQFPL